MTMLVIVLRVASLFAFAGPMLLRRTEAARRAGERGTSAPVIANFAAFALFVPSLFAFATPANHDMAPALAFGGVALTFGGAILVVASRAALGSAWSLAPRADESAGLVTSGPYRVVRHPIYLGLALIAVGQAIAFASWPALAVVVVGVVPSFVWRAVAEEALLARVLAERYADYRKATRMIIPFVL